MKSKVTVIKSNGEGMEEALRQTELCAQAYDLKGKDALHLRLLGEELMGMLRAVTGEKVYKYWIEENDSCFELHLSTETLMDLDKRDKLLSLSTTGYNAADKGFMGKIRSLIDILSTPESAGIPSVMELGMSDLAGESSLWLAASTATWSLNSYKNGIEQHMAADSEAVEAWDELERSIVGKIADEVSVALRGGNVEMIIYKSFPEK